MPGLREPCPDGTCTIVTAADDPESFDTSSLGGTPHAVHYGYGAQSLTARRSSATQTGWEKWER